MIPADSVNKIRSVTIHNRNFITGFSFFDKDGALLWKIGWTKKSGLKETVLLEENERIMGMVAKLHPWGQSMYTDF